MFVHMTSFCVQKKHEIMFILLESGILFNFA